MKKAEIQQLCPTRNMYSTKKGFSIKNIAQKTYSTHNKQLNYNMLAARESPFTQNE